MNLFRRRRITVPVGRYDAAADRWRDLADHGSAACHQLTVTTFNIWFNELHREQRHRAIGELLSREDPDVMVFQEVTRPALEVLLAQPWIREGYRRAAVIGDHNYGMLMLSRLPVRRCTYTRLPSRLSRGYLTGEFTVNGRDLTIVSVHLESGKTARQLRARQMSSLWRAFGDDGDVVILGDFNMRDDESSALDPRYLDVWPHLRPDDPGFTEDTSINHMRYDMKNKHRQVRFDRVLLKGPAWKAVDIGLLGRAPIAPSLPRIFPSDHFGVLCRLEAQPASADDRAGRRRWLAR
ncbi:MAG: endonuclease/exonuclease/phosphatase family protein [Mycolicibacterium rufum]|nr:endonuclease/exonuclease/phosphatase family protein [Mycolicibacterium rufum]